MKLQYLQAHYLVGHQSTNYYNKNVYIDRNVLNAYRIS